MNSISVLIILPTDLSFEIFPNICHDFVADFPYQRVKANLAYRETERERVDSTKFTAQRSQRPP